MKVVINKCHGGFGLSDAAYEKLIEYGIPVRGYIEQLRDQSTKLYLHEPKNDGQVIFDRKLESSETSELMLRLDGRYWDCWIRSNGRSHPLVIRVVEELGAEANGRYAELKIVEIPDDISYEITDYDGIEHVAQTHRTWG